MSLTIEGTIEQIYAPETRTGRNGTDYTTQGIVIEHGQEPYAKKAYITFDPNKVRANLAEGMYVEASINVESREYKGKYFTEIKAWKITTK